MIRKLIILSVLLLASSLHGEDHQYWVVRGFGIPLVGCELHGNKVSKCRYLTNSDRPLDGASCNSRIMWA